MRATAPLADTEIADLAVAAIHAEADLTPKPGLVDRRGPGAHTDMDLEMLHTSADSLHTALAACASAAAQPLSDAELRTRLGEIGRAGEHAMLAATGQVNTHRGTLWALGLLSAGAARGGDAVTIAARLAAIPDPYASSRTTDKMSHGSRVRRRYNGSGAVGEAQEGFPHVRRHALPTLRAARRSGADEATARLSALLALVATLEDTCVLHRGGPRGLMTLQSGARAVLNAGGVGTAQGRRHFNALDDVCLTQHLSPGGSGDLLSATLFLDALEKRITESCRP
ncbi:putative 2-(5''-triphosphoribosyl)-3'-dephosphocoenzyme-A synthase [Gordonia namibiensis NBRC 108229]|uniref:triphosphoribosyl-dephospho-CoA synthase n=1 Tax=Gordonia namibiensis NBRC 108229 TaxID=1208314 RepID=K6VR25_9ACTN|nr:triphosphoribosyl-dephospho-CoA synthase [Gordonia namibiensis]GAB98663.1 putative 2-(5''-triphosphoribosyl)-3'-dephosphocoenzyme-A synthase [Gordonia namibiensis NBRC 108229]